MNALFPFVAVLFKATPFGDAVEACKVGGEGTEVDGEAGEGGISYGYGSSTRYLLSGFGSRIFKVCKKKKQLAGLWQCKEPVHRASEWNDST